MNVKKVLLVVMILFYLLAGYNHFANPEFYYPLIPPLPFSVVRINKYSVWYHRDFIGTDADPESHEKGCGMGHHSHADRIHTQSYLFYPERKIPAWIH